MLRVLQAKQQHAAAEQQQAPPAPDPASVAGRDKYAKRYEGQFTGKFPGLDLYPLPSTLCKVCKLLARRDTAADLQALLLLTLCQRAAWAVCSAGCTAAQLSSTAAASSGRPRRHQQPPQQQHARPNAAAATADAALWWWHC